MEDERRRCLENYLNWSKRILELKHEEKLQSIAKTAQMDSSRKTELESSFGLIEEFAQGILSKDESARVSDYIISIAKIFQGV